jgi:AcrR family transcriptional regulator
LSTSRSRRASTTRAGKKPGRTRKRSRPIRDTRRAILDAARRRLAEGGPDAIRLQEIARDVGISHPAILHHFGSREGLTQAMAQDALDALEADLITALAEPADDVSAAAVLERVLETVGESGHARLFAWRSLSLEAPLPEHSEQELLRGLIDGLDQWRARLSRERGNDPAGRREAGFLARLVGAALLGEALLGPIFDLRAELDGECDAQAGFRRWLAENLAGLVESP